MKELFEGALVHYVLPADSRHPGENRPAWIVKIWNKNEPYTSNLCVLIDGSNDYSQPPGVDAQMTMWATSRSYSKDKEPGTWHWVDES